MSIREDALKNKSTDLMLDIAKKEKVPVEHVVSGIAEGSIAVFKNSNRNTNACATGKGLSTKVNANIGTSPLDSNIDFELEKLKVAEAAGADAIMDLSIGGNVNEIRKAIISATRLPLGTVPVYQAAYEKICQKKDVLSLTKDDFLHVIEQQGKEGVDFMTIHAGVTRETIKRFRSEGRVLDVVSRGGAILVRWIENTGNENPFFEYFDDVCAILKKHDVVLSLGDGMRPGCLADATDRAQINEMIVLGELTQRAWNHGVQVIIEGPGHVPLDQIKTNIQIEKQLCHGAPFYVLGPLVTDVAPGYDHIAGGIGGALAASYGADFLCYLTPAEHLRLPTIEDVREGVIATKIAAHAADIVKKVPGAWERNLNMSKARKNLDWNTMFDLSIDPVKARHYRSHSAIGEHAECTMCGEYCSIKNLKDNF